MTGPSYVPLHEIADAPIVYGIIQPGPETPDGIPFVQTRDLREALRAASLNHTSNEIAAAYSRSMLRTGDLLVALRGEIGTTQRVPAQLNGANISRGVARIRVGEAHDAEYVRQALASASTVRSLAQRSGGSALAEISIGQLRGVEIPVVPLREQRRIAEILRTWDDAIELTSRLRVAMTRRNAGQAMTLLSSLRSEPHIPLSTVATRVTRRTDGRDHTVMTISAKGGFVSQADKYARDMAGLSAATYTLLTEGEFAYNKGNSLTYPQGCIFRLQRESALVPSVYFSFRLAESLNPFFYAHYFAAGSLNQQLAQRISSGVRNNGLLNITASGFFDVLIPVPSRLVQDQIADALDSMRDEIALLDRKAELLREQKRGLAQKLLSGEIRVDTLNDEGEPR